MKKRLLTPETLKQEFFKVVWKAKRAWFFLKEKERRFQNSPDATLGRMDGTLKGCLVVGFLQLKMKKVSVLGETHRY